MTPEQKLGVSGHQVRGQFDIKLLSGHIKSRAESVLPSSSRDGHSVCVHLCVTGKNRALNTTPPSAFFAKGKTLAQFDELKKKKQKQQQKKKPKKTLRNANAHNNHVAVACVSRLLACLLIFAVMIKG